jgi:F0F1-type ATP synthase membrane subunit b/b'
MKIRSRSTIATIVTVLLCPALAFAAEGAEAPGTWTALIFYIINFGLFIWIVKRFGGPQISSFFKDRARNIRANMGRASQALHDAQELSKRAAQLTDGLAAEKQKMSADLAGETAFQMTQIDQQARESVDRIKRDATLSVDALRDAGQRRLRESLAAAAVQVARELVRRDFQPGDQTRLLQNFSSRLDEEARN